MASVSGRRMVNTEPSPALVSMCSAPPRRLISVATTSMPTPRPACWVMAPAVEKPGSRISCIASSSLRVWPAPIMPSACALSRMARRFMPPPSSVRRTMTSAPSRCSSSRMRPVSGLPRLTRSSGFSMPCTTALRSMCSNGGSMRSSTCRSSSPEAPSTLSSARLPVSAAAWRTMRARRCTWRWNGTMRVRISPFCSSVMVRACCCSRFCVSLARFSSSPWMLATSLAVSASAREYCWIEE